MLNRKDTSPEVSHVFQACAASALQAASGIIALSIACKTAGKSRAVLESFETLAEKEKFRILMESLAFCVDESWTTEIKELFEVLIILAIENSTMEEELRFRTWAQGLFLDTRKIKVDDSEDVRADIELDDDEEPKTKRLRKAKRSKEVYDAQRFENLVTKSVAMGIKNLEPIFIKNQICIMGESSKGKQQIIKIRGTMTEALELCQKANEEIRSMHVGDHFL